MHATDGQMDGNAGCPRQGVLSRSTVRMVYGQLTIIHCSRHM